MVKDAFVRSIMAAVLLCTVVVPAVAQSTSRTQQSARDAAAAKAAGVTLPPGFVIGAQDLLGIVFWHEDKMSADVVVRPDGKISLPLLNDIQAAGQTPEELGENVARAASKFVADPVATVIVKQINSRKVFVLGQVARPGTVNLIRDMNVLQLIAEVGGLQEYADKDSITIIRMENGKERRFRFNYNDVLKGKNIEQNILLKPDDTVLVR